MAGYLAGAFPPTIEGFYLVPYKCITLFNELVERHNRVKQEYEEQSIASEQDVGMVSQIDYFISSLEKLNAPVTEFDRRLWISMVDHVVVSSKEDIRVVYRDGMKQ